MNASCPCHTVYADPVRFYDHLCLGHGLQPSAAFLLAVAALSDLPIEYVADDRGGILVCGVQLPLPS
jgi:hypothetical protein